MALLAARQLLRVLPQAIAVVRPDDLKLMHLLMREGLRVIPCPDAAKGMGLSIACGVTASADAAGWVITLADMPYTRASSIAGVVGLLAHGAQLAAPRYQGQRGHPVGFHHALRDSLLSLEGDTGARHLLQSHGKLLQYFDVDDPGVIKDIDVPGDLHA